MDVVMPSNEFHFLTDKYSLEEYPLNYCPPLRDMSGRNTRTVESDYVLRIKAGLTRRVYKSFINGEIWYWVTLGRKYYFHEHEIEGYAQSREAG